MKLTMAKCPRCDRRDEFSRPVLAPSCADCGAPMERTSRLAVGRWHLDGVALGLKWGRRADRDGHEFRP